MYLNNSHQYNSALYRYWSGWVVFQGGSGPRFITINGETLEQVSNFKYLGTIITEEGSCEKEINTRIAMAKQAFSTHWILLTSGLNLHLKKRIVKTMVWSVLLYGSEIWTLKTAYFKRLDSFEM